MANKPLSDDDLLESMFDAINNGTSLDVAGLATAPAEEVTEEPSPTEVGEELESPDTVVVEEPEGEIKDNPPEPVAPVDTNWRSKLPEDLREAADKEFSDLKKSHDYYSQYQRSNEGRVSSLQKKIDRLESTVASHNTPKPAATAAPATPEEDSPVMQELKENDPAMYSALRAERQEITKGFDKRIQDMEKYVTESVNSRLEPLQAVHEQAYLSEQAHLVEQYVPEVRGIISSPEWARFVSESPPAVLKLAESKDHREFISAIDTFTIWAMRQYGFPESQKGAAVVAAPSVASGKLQESRNRKLTASAGVKPSPATRPEELDEEAFVEKLFQDIRKENGYS